jgi:protein SCO1/2
MTKPSTPPPPQKKNNRALTIIIIIIIILALLGIFSHYKQKNVQPNNNPNNPPTQPINNNNNNPNQTQLPQPKSMSSFTLTDDSGQAFSNDNLKGHWTLMFFGFTHCGDVCPLTLTELSKMYTELQKETPSDQLPQVLFVSVDPQRDNTEVLHRYIKSYNPNFIAATGDDPNLNIFTQDLGVFFKKVEKDNGGYGMDHSSQIFVFNPAGNWVGMLSYPFQAQQLVQSFKSFQ